MSDAAFFTTSRGRKLAYHRHPGQGPWVVFLGGLKSDMMGTKAVFLEEWARAAGRAFLRFDYSGHGESSGEFTDGCIGDWAEDTAEIVAELTEGPIVPVGSSMGGWQALLLASFVVACALCKFQPPCCHRLIALSAARQASIAVMARI